MTEKRYKMIKLDSPYLTYCCIEDEDEYLIESLTDACDLLNEQDERIKELETEKELLKKDGNNLIQLLENQSLIICELHSKLMEYWLKEPIVLTKEGLELMGEAVSYYTHGRCPE